MTWEQLLQTHRDGHGLPRESYISPELHAAEMAAIWRRGWLLAGLTCELPEPGHFFTLTVDGDSLLIVRDDDGRVRSNRRSSLKRAQETKLVSDASPKRPGDYNTAWDSA